MSRFYGGVWGQAGEATRMGSKRSGMTAYAQSWQSRLSIKYYCYNDEDRATITIGGGPSSGYRDHCLNISVDEIAHALDVGDKRVNRIWERIRIEFNKLDEEAPKAIKRAVRRQKIERNREERERKAAFQQRQEWLDSQGGKDKLEQVRNEAHEVVNDSEKFSEGYGSSIYQLRSALAIELLSGCQLEADVFSIHAAEDVVMEIINEEMDKVEEEVSA